MSSSRVIAGQWHIAVVIPANNEAQTIAACIQAVGAALDACEGIHGSWIVVACDSCTDATAAIAREALGHRGEVVECKVASAGTARRIGVATALVKYGAVPRKNLWIANTDADTCVPPDWIERQLEIADTGSAAVAGIVRVDSIAECSDVQLQQLFADYLVNADGTHSHVHGANIGVRADAYLAAGGWHDKPLAEDHCLWGRLKGQDWPVTSTAALIVTTSGRLLGRAAGGFATTLSSKVGALYA